MFEKVSSILIFCVLSFLYLQGPDGIAGEDGLAGPRVGVLCYFVYCFELISMAVVIRQLHLSVKSQPQPSPNYCFGVYFLQFC